MSPAISPIRRCELVIGLPHTNLGGLSEVRLMMQAGHFQWNSIAAALNKPLSTLRTKEGHPIYATFFYIDSKFPEKRPIGSFKLDESLLFLNKIKQFKGMSIDGEILFDRVQSFKDADRPDFDFDREAKAGRHPTLRMCNVFISHEGSNEFLKITTPEGCSFENMETIASGEEAYPITRAASKHRAFDLFDKEWSPIDKEADFSFDYTINPDRDTNGAGLVYFAQYIAFMDAAERQALLKNSSVPFSLEQINHRTLVRRKIAYFANVDLENTLTIVVALFRNNRSQVGARYQIFRKSDKKLIALSESIKSFPVG